MLHMKKSYISSIYLGPMQKKLHITCKMHTVYMMSHIYVQHRHYYYGIYDEPQLMLFSTTNALLKLFTVSHRENSFGQSKCMQLQRLPQPTMLAVNAMFPACNYIYIYIYIFQ